MSLFGELFQCSGRDRNQTSLGGKTEQLSCKVVLLVVEDDKSPLCWVILFYSACFVCKLEVIEEPNMKGKPSTSKAEAITGKHCLGVWGRNDGNHDDDSNDDGNDVFIMVSPLIYGILTMGIFIRKIPFFFNLQRRKCGLERSSNLNNVTQP